MTLLIVDDNREMRRMIRRVIGELAGDICECDDGAEALDAYLRHCPDLVVMDIEMPRMDGIAATRQIIAACPAAKVVIVTRHDDDQMRETARQAGACGYVLKENLFDLRRLLQAQI